MHLSQRAQTAPPSPIRKLVPLADEAKRRGVRVFHLNIGQPDIATPKPMWEAISRAGIEVLDYSPSGGIPAFRQALIGYFHRWGHEVAPEHLLVTTAGSEAILFALATVCDPGDEVIIPEPFYANYNGYATLLGVRVVPVTSVAESGYAIPPREKLEACITSRTRAFILCNPSNPTGRVYTQAEMDMLVGLVAEHDLVLISDEVYREFCYTAERPISVLSFPEIADKAIMVDSISKRFSACGARVGCMVSRNAHIIASAMKFAQARLSPPTLGQIMGAAAYAMAPSYFDEVLVEYRRRRDVLMEELARIPGVVCQVPQGAFYAMPKLPVEDAEDFVRWLLTDYSLDGETTMMAPGNGFYATPGAGRSEVRIAYVLKEEHLRRAMRVVSEGLWAYRQTRLTAKA
jgi:aspartate aminotransferase